MWLFGRQDPLDVVEEALKRRGWKYQRLDAQTILTGVVTASQRFYFIAIRHESDKRTVLLLFNPLRGAAQAIQALTAGRPPILRIHPDEGYSGQQVAEVCEKLMHQNYRIVLGCFERDERDGEIRFRIAIPYRDTNLTVEQVNWCIDIGVHTLEAAMSEIEKVIGEGRVMI